MPLRAPRKATGQAQALFEAIIRRHGHPRVATYYRAFAAWPQGLHVARDYLEPMVGSATSARHKEGVIDRALHVVRRLSLPRTGTAVAFGVTGGGTRRHPRYPEGMPCGMATACVAVHT
jgi:hypothetical protein